MKNPFRKKKEVCLPPETAEQMLANVFIACGREPNTVPLEALTSYSNYRKERYFLQRSVIVVVLLLFMLLPMLFFAADVHITLSNPGSGENPVYAVSVSGALPMRQIQARQGGRTVPLYEISENEFMLQPRSNGNVSVAVTLLNRQHTAVSLSVEDVDMDAPVLLRSENGGDYIRFYLSDAGCGVDFAGIAIVDASGSKRAPLGWDADAGSVDLPYPECRLNVSIPDLRGNTLRVALKPE